MPTVDLTVASYVQSFHAGAEETMAIAIASRFWNQNHHAIICNVSGVLEDSLLVSTKLGHTCYLVTVMRA